MEQPPAPVAIDDIDDAFPTFVRANYVALVRYGTSLIGDAGKAEDLVQAALLRVSRAWSRVDPARRDRYTRTVMARLAWRQARRQWNGEVPTAALPDLAGAGRSAFDAVDDGDSLRRALDLLPLRQRVVLTLRYLDELSEEETAKALHCAVGTVKSRAARGLAALRRSGLTGRDDDGARSCAEEVR